MLVRRIKKFIEELNAVKGLKPFDEQLLIALKDRFKSRTLDEILNADDIKFITELFKTRWDKVFDTEHDYTRDSQGVNQLWIALAKEFASFIKVSYVTILFPTVTNTLDFNNASELTETDCPENFFLSNGNRTLGRKKSLCDYLVHGGSFILSTHRDALQHKGQSPAKLSHMTVRELTRLQSCKHQSGKFTKYSEDTPYSKAAPYNKEFEHFWDFLQREVFPKLNPKKDVPLDLLPYLFHLIEQYYTLKAAKADFSLFKVALKEFLAHLYKYELENINLFYGVVIKHGAKNFYLLDFLMDMDKADDFDLGARLIPVVTWLYRMNPALEIAKNHALMPIYQKVQEESPCKLIVPDRNAERMLLSLFTVPFQYVMVGSKISFWDCSNTVCSEAAEIYKICEPLITQKSVDLVALSKKVLDDVVNPRLRKCSMFDWCTRYSSTDTWLRHIKNRSLDELDIHWFEPELMLHTLLHFRTENAHTVKEIGTFIDELIHTYAQNVNEFQKQLRVNILFDVFLKKINSQEKKILLLLLQLYADQDVKSTFLENCIYHVGTRLGQFNVHRPGGSTHFFIGTHRMDELKLVIPRLHITEVRQITAEYRKRLGASDIRIETDLLSKMLEYLQNLVRPILTCAEIEVARASARTLDYLAAPT